MSVGRAEPNTGKVGLPRTILQTVIDTGTISWIDQITVMLDLLNRFQELHLIGQEWEQDKSSDIEKQPAFGGLK